MSTLGSRYNLESLAAELDSLDRIVRRQSREGRVARPLQGDLHRLIRDYSNILPQPVAQSHTVLRAIDRVNAAIATGRTVYIYDAIKDLRNAISHVEPWTVGIDLRAAESKIARLEEELQDLRKEREDDSVKDETETEFENMAKKFRNAKNKVFVIMPFSDDFNDVFEGGIKKACQADFAPLRVDQISLSSGITADVKQYIEKATTVVADVTGNNPNVMFELGYALGRRKDPIIIVQPQEATKVPFDIADIRHLEYTDSWRGIEQLAKNLRKFLTTTSEQQKSKK